VYGNPNRAKRRNTRGCRSLSSSITACRSPRAASTGRWRGMYQGDRGENRAAPDCNALGCSPGDCESGNSRAGRTPALRSEARARLAAFTIQFRWFSARSSERASKRSSAAQRRSRNRGLGSLALRLGAELGWIPFYTWGQPVHVRPCLYRFIGSVSRSGVCRHDHPHVCR